MRAEHVEVEPALDTSLYLVLGPGVAGVPHSTRTQPSWTSSTVSVRPRSVTGSQTSDPGEPGDPGGGRGWSIAPPMSKAPEGLRVVCGASGFAVDSAMKLG